MKAALKVKYSPESSSRAPKYLLSAFMFAVFINPFTAAGQNMLESHPASEAGPNFAPARPIRLVADYDLPNAPAPQSEATKGYEALSSGRIIGVVQDIQGALITGATITVEEEASPRKWSTLSDDAGHFQVEGLNAGTYTVTIAMSGFEAMSKSGILLTTYSNQAELSLTLQVAGASSTVQAISVHDLAKQQLEIEEKQRLFGVVPNFYVTYAEHPAPLSAGQKMQLAFRQMVDPFQFGITAVVAGVEQAQHTYSGYGYGAGGYGKRYAAAYGDAVVFDLVGAGIAPALLHQDPRYFYKGTGTTRSRVAYAILTPFRIKGDNGKWQPNYSGLLGTLASTGLSETYIPHKDRDSVKVIIDGSFESVASASVGALLQEFVFNHVTTHFKAQRPKNQESSTD